MVVTIVLASLYLVVGMGVVMMRYEASHKLTAAECVEAVLLWPRDITRGILAWRKRRRWDDIERP
jgi:hypothetical protein